MPLLNSLFKKKPREILTDEDKVHLREIERKAYLTEAIRLTEIKGRERAKTDLEIKPKKEAF